MRPAELLHGAGARRALRASHYEHAQGRKSRTPEAKKKFSSFQFEFSGGMEFVFVCLSATIYGVLEGSIRPAFVPQTFAVAGGRDVSPS